MHGIASAPRRSGFQPSCLLPGGTVCLGALLSLQPLHLLGYGTVAPAFALIALFHWTIYRPNLLPAGILFGIGLMEDLLTDGHLGLTAALLMMSRMAVLRYRRWFLGQSFMAIWAKFAALPAGVLLTAWILESALTLQVTPFNEIVIRIALTVSIFPFASWLLGRAQRAVLG